MKTCFIALTFADDSIGIMQFVLSDQRAGWIREPTEENVNSEIARSSFEDGKTPIKRWRFISQSEIPNDKEYRNSWRDDGRTIYHDMKLAREMYREKIRAKRSGEFSKLDVEYVQADEQNNLQLKFDVVKKKQKLRDLTKDARIENAQTIDELRSINLFDD